MMLLMIVVIIIVVIIACKLAGVGKLSIPQPNFGVRPHDPFTLTWTRPLHGRITGPGAYMVLCTHETLARIFSVRKFYTRRQLCMKGNPHIGGAGVSATAATSGLRKKIATTVLNRGRLRPNFYSLLSGT